MSTTIYQKLAEAEIATNKAALCTVVGSKGSSPRKAGAKMIVYEDGSIFGSIGGGELENQVIKDALKCILEEESKLFRHDLLHHHQMCCGGSMDVFIEPVQKKNNLYIFGAGHTGIALADMASKVGFEVYLIDDRKEYVDACINPCVNKMNLDFELAASALPFGKNVFSCILTYRHDIDRALLSQLIKKQHQYLGMIGSKRKVAITKKIFLESNYCSDDELAWVDMPMGININANTPEEIAVSILSKLIQIKNDKFKKAESASNRSGERNREIYS